MNSGMIKIVITVEVCKQICKMQQQSMRKCQSDVRGTNSMFWAHWSKPRERGDFHEC